MDRLRKIIEREEKLKIVVFGVGHVYQCQKRLIKRFLIGAEIVAFLDNYCEKKSIEGIPLYRPNVIQSIEYDMVLIMSRFEDEMKKQLMDCGVFEEDVYFWDDIVMESSHYEISTIIAEEIRTYKKRALLVANSLYYDGGTVAISSAAEALKLKGYYVLLLAKGGHGDYVLESYDAGIRTLLYPNLQLLLDNKKFIQCFDVAIVNVFPMVKYAVLLSHRIPVAWWIHEQKDIIEETIKKDTKYCKIEEFKHIRIYAVARIAKENFNYFYNDRIQLLLPYGIKDQYKEEKKSNNKIIFAIIGTVMEIKAQDVFIKASNRIIGEYDDIEFWIVGALRENEYCKKIIDMASNSCKIKLMGTLTRKEIHEAFKQISVVVCPSRKDNFPIVLVEAMMFRKPIIVSENVGTVDYLKDAYNCMICNYDDDSSLYDKMIWMIKNRKKLDKMGDNARAVYDEFFSMEKFADRLEDEVKKTIDNYEY